MDVEESLVNDDSDDDDDINPAFAGQNEDPNNDEASAEDFSKRLRMVQIELPPPLELIAKTAYREEEPVKTGAPIAFLSLA